ncbi:MAG: hypothetical protein L3J03_11705 [Desulfobacterales bacterium]|nr:hypothetical protein [Desulfobacterales bacterium]
MTSKTVSTFCLLFFVFCLLLSTPALAHKVRIFAYGEGNTIIGETAFSGGRAPRDSEIIVQDAANGRTLFTCRTDDHGNFRFPIPAEARRDRLDLRIIINVGEGHRGEWLLAADEYLDDEQQGETVATSAPDKVAAVAGVAPAGNTTQTISTDEELVRRVVEQAMDKKLGPIKHMLVQSLDQGPRFQDILGGIGYLIGMAGIIAYFKSKKGEKK